MSADDLSGEWRGIFNYPRDLPPTAFEATLADNGGALVGQVREPDLFSQPPGVPISAALDGRREGHAVRFTKFYDEGDRGYDIVTYQGQVNASGSEISGTWTIVGVWSGNFLMVRPVAEEEEAAAEAMVPPVPVADLPDEGA